METQPGLETENFHNKVILMKYPEFKLRFVPVFWQNGMSLVNSSDCQSWIHVFFTFPNRQQVLGFRG